MFWFKNKKVQLLDITNCVPIVLTKMYFQENNEMNIHYHICYKNIDTKKCFWKTNKIVESNKWFSEYLSFIIEYRNIKHEIENNKEK